MARTSGASAMLDIRSVSILYDVVYATEDIAQKTVPFRRDVDGLPLRTDDSFDSEKSWFVLLCVMALSTLAHGVLHSSILLATYPAYIHELTFVHTALISSATYALFIITSPMACYLVRSWGPRFVSAFGMLLGFIGLTLLALQIHPLVHVVGNIVFIGIGCSLVQTAVMSCVVYAPSLANQADFFKEHLLWVVTILSLASPLATMIFIIFSYFVGINGLFEYKWLMLCYALLFIAAVGITRKLPHTIRIPGHRDSIRAAEIAQKVKKCLKESNPKRMSNSTMRHSGEFTCACTCVCDIGILHDMAFYLWGVICFCTMLTFYIPFICLVAYVKVEFSFGYKTAVGFVCGFCTTSILSRVLVHHLNDFTFVKTRSLFQIGLFATAAIYFFICKAVTFGWVMAVCLALGVAEGIFVVIIPRITLLVFPRKNLPSTWQFLAIFHGLAVFVGPMFMVLSTRANGGEIVLPCIIIGTLQIASALLTFLIPEVLTTEDSSLDSEPSTPTSKDFEIHDMSNPYSQSGNLLPYVENTPVASHDVNTNFFEIPIPNTDKLYSDDCPVCSKLGFNPKALCEHFISTTTTTPPPNFTNSSQPL